MRLIEIAARSFRNLSPDPVFFGAGVTLITGENAQGKTNLLEAVAVLCGQRSFRRVKPHEMASSESGFSITGKLRRGAEKSPEAETLRVDWSPGSGRTFARGEKAVSFREASRLAPAVFLAPEHREILTGAPAIRRRFLDRLALLCRPAAGEDLASFERALAERNALLSGRARGRAADDEMEAWTEELVRAGAAVRHHRRAALAEWKTHFEPLAADAGTEYSAVEIAYISDGETEEDLRAECRRVLPVEIRRGHTLAGPHRDDLRFARHGRPLAVQASAGEIHRTAALVKLAEWRAIREATGEPPLLGVDEFDAGLSSAWADAFVRSLPRDDGGTVLLTSAGDAAPWRALVGSVVEMRAGRAVSRPRAVNEE
ncbi:MAG TPA: DNA replication and repair protein RecF [Thermoanaerobaculia bacterium]|nr:DNA replication and repair protein RecF [Thermoanaerobaculia bacterium]